MYNKIFKEFSSDIGRGGCNNRLNISAFRDLANKHNVSLGLIYKLYQDYIVIIEGSRHLWKTASGYGTDVEMKNRKKYIKKLLLSNQAILRDCKEDLNYFLIFGKITNIKILIIQNCYLTSTNFTYCTARKEIVIDRINKLDIKLSKNEIDYIADKAIELKRKQVKDDTLPCWSLKFS